MKVIRLNDEQIILLQMLLKKEIDNLEYELSQLSNNNMTITGQYLDKSSRYKQLIKIKRKIVD